MLHVGRCVAVAVYGVDGVRDVAVVVDYYGWGRPSLRLLADLRDCTRVAAFLGITSQRGAAHTAAAAAKGPAPHHNADAGEALRTIAPQRHSGSTAP